MKKVLSLVLSLMMLLSLVVPVSAEDTYPGSGDLAGKTAAFTIEADDTTLYDNGGEQIVKFHIYVESKDNVPIRAFQFTLKPSANLTLATELAENSSFSYGYMNTDTLIKSTTNVDGMYSRFEYTPDSRFFGAAGTDEGKGITEKTEIMTIMGKVNGVGDYTLSMSGVVAGNGNALNNIADKFNCTAAGATVTVKPESEQPQPNLSLALSTDKVKVGDTFTATLSNKGMTVSSFIAQLEFDKEMLTVTGIEQLGGFAKLAAGATIDPVLSTPDEANDRSLVGVGFVRGSDKTHEAGEFLRVTFQAKATGSTAISLHEDSDGTNGYRGDISGGTVTVEAAAVTGVTVSGTVKSYGGETENVTVTLTPENGTPMTTVVTGNSAAYKFENVSAGTYTLKVEKKGHAPWTESITVGSAAVTKDVTVYLYGDVNRNGTVTVLDASWIRQHLVGKKTFDEYQLQLADVNKSGNISVLDASWIRQRLVGIRNEYYEKIN
ncbi:MAG: dockerin type I domain-containing protein [Vescimonas sp.]|uniref:dockerin type I domain-containing protein n=1 Tax=Vescimonas sp. TaxID=2892404 RepID=UPI002A90B503|nr:dockerin type I domain-containing protein [Vescimonas sp.]MDY5334319.1 dockerin type I domain-containing protein [Vescimonas sp.]